MQEEIISYWTSETGWSSELQLRNNSLQDLTVTPSLRMADGTETALSAVTYNPLNIPDAGTADQGVDAPNMCDGGVLEDVSDSFYGNWRTGNTSIATVDFWGTHTGKALGSTTTNTNGQINNNDQHSGYPLVTLYPLATTT